MREGSILKMVSRQLAARKDYIAGIRNLYTIFIEVVLERVLEGQKQVWLYPRKSCPLLLLNINLLFGELGYGLEKKNKIICEKERD